MSLLMEPFKNIVLFNLLAELQRKNKEKKEKMDKKDIMVIKEKSNILAETPDTPKPKNRAGPPKASDNFKTKQNLTNKTR